MVDDTSEEEFFRERYSKQLRELGSDAELKDELQRVKHQGMKTPGRRGETIKREEIDRETIRRHYKDKK